MSRKQNTYGWAGSSIARSKANISYKENQKSQTYQLDPKIAELKKKYQLDKHQPSNVSYLAHRPSSSNIRQQQVLKKLQNIKSELQSIPDWQSYARSILFSESSVQQTNSIFTKSKPNFFNPNQKYSIHNIAEENCEDSKIMDNSNISFKINQATSIQRPQLKSQQRKYSCVQPSLRQKGISQFTFDKQKYQKKEHNKSKDQKPDKFDDKINQISRKIMQSEQKKRKLGVQFVPFEKKTSQLRYQSPKPNAQQNFVSTIPSYLLLKTSTSVQKLQNRPPKPPAVSTTSAFKYNQPSVYDKKIIEKFQQVSPRFAGAPEVKSKQESFQNKYKLNNQLNKFEWEKQLLNYQKKNRTYSVHINSNNPNNNAQHQNKIIENNLYNEKNKIMLQKAEQSLKQRKKKIVNFQQEKKSKQITQKLVQNLCQQVKLDEKFRNCKLWFKACKNDKKLDRLKNLLDYQGIKLTQQKLQQEFVVLQKEDNPFFSVSSQECDIEQVAKSYIQSQKYWKRNIYKQFNKNCLEKEDFNNLSIDLDKKGYIVLEDLVRFLNMETGTFFRNRDLFTIFRRISNNNQKVNFNSFINCLYV